MMDATIQTPIPSKELDVFQHLKDIWVVVDVGARIDTDYLELKSHITCHLFEPHPVFFQVLKDKVGLHANVHLNNYGLGDVAGEFSYNETSQKMEGAEGGAEVGPLKFRIETLDPYIKEKGITRIDFLKIDCEGYDYKVLLGAPEAVKMSRYIQYEHWDDKTAFHTLLEKNFDMHYIGYRNVLCVNRNLVSRAHRDNLVAYLRQQGINELII